MTSSIRFRWLAAVVVSLSLHAVLLGGPKSSASRVSGPATATSLLVRMLTASRDPAPVGKQAVEASAGANIAESTGKGTQAEHEAPAEGPAGARARQSASGRLEEQAMATDPSPTGSRSAAEDSPAALSSRAGQAESGLPPATGYAFGAQLDPRPTPLDEIEPLFPAEAGLQEGVVVLRILISEAGVVDDVAVIRSSPKGLFERSAIVAFQAARFSPGFLLGLPVKSQINVEVNFTPFNRGAAVSGRGY